MSQILKTTYTAYSSISNNSLHANFNKALLKYNGSGTKLDKEGAFDIFNSLISKAWDGNYELFLPVLTMKYSLSLYDMYLKFRQFLPKL
mmetsp:Transcript_16736/g.14658  ORF Transcript_16736/g.14658 Transcript_16736/m.14658 type:complete len:89 (-) Transcript_16736:7-273(-)